MSDIDLNKMTIPQLKQVAKSLEIKGFSRKNKKELIEMIKAVNKQYQPVTDTETYNMGDKQDNIWHPEEPIHNKDDLIEYSKDDLIRIYQKTKDDNQIVNNISYSSLLKKSKDELIDIIIEMAQNFRVMGLPKINFNSIPKVPKGLYVIGSKGTGYSSEKTLRFGIVKAQRPNGNLSISVFEALRELGPNEGGFVTYTVTPTEKVSYNLTARAQPGETKWLFVTNERDGTIHWAPWDKANKKVYTERFDTLR